MISQAYVERARMSKAARLAETLLEGGVHADEAEHAAPLWWQKFAHSLGFNFGASEDTARVTVAVLAARSIVWG